MASSKKLARQTENAKKKSPPTIVSLFSGAGGLDHGFASAGFKIGAAFDISEAAIKTHRRNFKNAVAHVADLTVLRPRGVVEAVLHAIPPKTHIGIIGGPPCQGFSRANTRSTSDDPRNDLPRLYTDVIRELQKHYHVDFVVFENVLGMRDKKHAEVYHKLLARLTSLGFEVDEQELCALDFGVPQMRKRIILSAVRGALPKIQTVPSGKRLKKNVRDAIGGLPAPTFFSRTLLPSDIKFHPNHWTMNPISPRFAKPGAITPGGRSFKQLTWTKPSPTIAFGNREIHVHPNGRRRLSIYEAMLLQGFPKRFVLEGNLSEQVQQVSNAVPPPLARQVAAAIRRVLDT